MMLNNIAIGILLLSVPGFVLARDMGLPMIIVVTPYMFFAFIPIILIEGFIIAKNLKLKFTRILLSVTLANLVSTFIMIPLVWVLLFIFQLVLNALNIVSEGSIFYPLFVTITKSPWLTNGRYSSNTPLAILILFIPFFYVSWKVETRIIYKKIQNTNIHEVSDVCLKANIITFLLLSILPVVDLIR